MLAAGSAKSDRLPAAHRRVVADSSPLIGLATAGALGLLRELYGTVFVTRAVVEEVKAGEGRPGVDELERAMREGWIRVAPTPLATWRYTGLDTGEASTIALAREGGDAVLVLMDDALGREQAAALGLELADVAGLLLAAKQSGFLDDVASMLERLARKGFTISPERRREVLAAAGEAGGD